MGSFILPGIEKCGCGTENEYAIYYCHQEPKCNAGQTFYCKRCAKKHNHFPIMIADECSEMKQDYGKVVEKVLQLKDDLDACYGQFQEFIELCQEKRSHIVMTPMNSSSMKGRNLQKDASAIGNLAQQVVVSMRQVETLCAANKLLELKDL